MKSLCIIVFYFGKYPWYHNYFIDSCKRNPSIDFIFLTDRASSRYLDKNITYIPFSITDFNSLATVKLGFKIDVRNGLKICDFRPAFGVIFNEYINEYDYWGYSDTDIILGNLRYFLDNETLAYDYISVRDDYPSGYFSILKNKPNINYLFTLSKDYKRLFQEEKNTLFEECGGAYDEVCHGVNILNSACQYETFHHVLEKNKNNIKTFFEFFSLEGNVGNITVTKENLKFMDKFEIMMYHLTSYKNNLFSTLPTTLLKPTFFISQYSFSSTKGNGWMLKIYLKKLYFFKLAHCFSKSLKHSFINNGCYNYMNEVIKVEENKIILLSANISYEVKKIPFTQFFLFGNYIIKVKSESTFDIFSSNGKQKTYSYMNAGS